jgi:hypothetical protein
VLIMSATAWRLTVLWCSLYVLAAGLALTETLLIALPAQRSAPSSCRCFKLAVACTLTEAAGIITIVLTGALVCAALLHLKHRIQSGTMRRTLAAIDLVGHVLLILVWLSLSIILSVTGPRNAYSAAQVTGACLLARVLVGLSWATLVAFLASGCVGIALYQHLERVEAQTTFWDQRREGCLEPSTGTCPAALDFGVKAHKAGILNGPESAFGTRQVEIKHC